jgi:DNA end-binding protein Ku
MARPIWKGQIAFGLVSVPIVLYSAESTAADSVSFHMVDKNNLARIRYQRVNEATGEKVEWADIVKSYELEDGSLITFTDADLDEIAVKANQSVEIAEFVDEHQIDRSYFAKPYFLVPEKRGRKGYVILREALKDKKKLGIAKVVIRTREYLAALAAEGDTMMLYLLRYPHEIRQPKPEDIPTTDEVEISDKEQLIAGQLVDALSADFDPAAYKDEYRESLLKWIEERAAQGGQRPPSADGETTDQPAEVIDIMGLLKASMEQAKSSKKKSG